MTEQTSSVRANSHNQHDDQEKLAPMLDIIEEDIDNIVALRISADRQASMHQKVIEKITHNLGRPRTFYFILGASACWIVLNIVGIFLHLTIIDAPPFFWLQGGVGFIALLTTTAVLITQNRQAKLTEQRSHLDLELSLLIERKTSKLIELVEELRRDLPIVENRHDPQAEAMKESADPAAVITSFQQTLKEACQDELKQ